MMAQSSTFPPSDETRGPQILALTWSTDALAMIAVALRIYVRTQDKSIGWDDYTICLALVRPR